MSSLVKSFWSTLKLELVYRPNFPSRSEATTAIVDHIEAFCNRSRLHSALGFKSPLYYKSHLQLTDITYAQSVSVLSGQGQTSNVNFILVDHFFNQ